MKLKVYVSSACSQTGFTLFVPEHDDFPDFPKKLDGVVNVLQDLARDHGTVCR